LIDTSVWIDVFRDKTLRRRNVVERYLGGDEPALTRFNQLELLQGARDETEWNCLNEFLNAQTYFEMSPESWNESARIYYDLRRRGLTVRSSIDCCIAQMAIDHDLLLLHKDSDFSTIAEVRPALRARMVSWTD
jgi:hypothetical protein